MQSCQRRVEAVEQTLSAVALPDLAGLAHDLAAAWDAPGVTMRARQQLLHTLVQEIIADVDEQTHEIVLTIHWRGGQHSQVRLAKPKSDEHVAATLNRMGLPTGRGKTWTAHRVSSVRKVNDIRAYLSAHKDGQWLTMSEAAAKLGVNNHRIRRLIKEGLLLAEQVVPRAPYQIRSSDLLDQRVIEAIERTHGPCQAVDENQISMFSST